MPACRCLIVRGRDSKLRAFLNVCRHRGAKVAQGCRQGPPVLCVPIMPGATDLAGKVMGIPDERNFPDVRGERSTLTPLPLCEKHGLVWVILTPAADAATEFDIDPWLGGLGPELRRFGFASWAFYDKRIVPEAMNWKILRRHLPRGLSHRLSAQGLAEGDSTRQRHGLRGLWLQPSPRRAPHEA